MRKLLVTTAVVLLPALCPALASAADGILDNRYFDDGKHTISQSFSDDVAALPDGRFVSVGDLASDNDVSVIEDDGSLDTGFGGGDGLVQLANMDATDVVVQDDGKIVVVGPDTVQAIDRTRIVRLTTTGALDPAFGGGDGIVIVNLGVALQDIPTDIAVGPDGEIVVAGTERGSASVPQLGEYAQNEGFDVARLDSDGDPDNGFSGNGLASFDLNPTTGDQQNYATSVDIQDDGRIVVAGMADVSALTDTTILGGGDGDHAEEETFVAIRVTTAGALDSTFASGTGTSYPNVVTGTTDCDTSGSGQLDCTHELEVAEDVEVQDDGKIVLAGYVDSNSAGDLNHDGDPENGQEAQEIDNALVRLNANGSIDTGFGGGDARVTTAMSPNTTAGATGFDNQDDDRAVALEIQEDGKLLVAGPAEFVTSGQERTVFGIARYTTTGTLDSSWDGNSGTDNGKVFLNLTGTNTAFDRPGAMDLLPNGSVLIGGRTGTGGAYAALKTDGEPPNTAIISGPSEGSTITDNTPTFTFFAGISETGATFHCRYVGVQIVAVPCSSPYTRALPNGPHTFEVQATDSNGNLDNSPDVRQFTVNASPPDTTLTNPGTTPGAFTADTTPTFNFTSTPGGATFECGLLAGHDLGPLEEQDFVACSGSGTHTPSAVADGEYTFAARATDVSGTDPTPATFEVEVDTDAPNGVIVQAPSGTITDHTPDFQVTTDEPDDIAEGEFTMTCEINSSPPQSTPCDTNAFSFSEPLPDGTYTFTLQVQDLLARTDATPATATFTVTTPVDPPPTGGGDTGGQQTGSTAPKRCKKGRKLKKGRCVKKKKRKKK